MKKESKKMSKKKTKRIRILFGQQTTDVQSVFKSAFKEENGQLVVTQEFKKIFEDKARLKPKIAKPLPANAKIENTMDGENVYRIHDKQNGRHYEIALECGVLNFYKMIRRREVSPINRTNSTEKQMLRDVNTSLVNKGLRGAELNKAKIEALNVYRTYSTINRRKLVSESVDEIVSQTLKITPTELRKANKTA